MTSLNFHVSTVNIQSIYKGLNQGSLVLVGKEFKGIAQDENCSLEQLKDRLYQFLELDQHHKHIIRLA